MSQNVSCENNFLKASGIFLSLIGIAHSFENKQYKKNSLKEGQALLMPATVGLTGASLFIAGKYFCK